MECVTVNWGERGREGVEVGSGEEGTGRNWVREGGRQDKMALVLSTALQFSSSRGQG